MEQVCEAQAQLEPTLGHWGPLLLWHHSLDSCPQPPPKKWPRQAQDGGWLPNTRAHDPLRNFIALDNIFSRCGRPGDLLHYLNPRQQSNPRPPTDLPLQAASGKGRGLGDGIKSWLCVQGCAVPTDICSQVSGCHTPQSNLRGCPRGSFWSCSLCLPLTALRGWGAVLLGLQAG